MFRIWYILTMPKEMLRSLIILGIPLPWSKALLKKPMYNLLLTKILNRLMFSLLHRKPMFNPLLKTMNLFLNKISLKMTITTPICRATNKPMFRALHIKLTFRVLPNKLMSKTNPTPQPPHMFKVLLKRPTSRAPPILNHIKLRSLIIILPSTNQHKLELIMSIVNLKKLMCNQPLNR